MTQRIRGKMRAECAARNDKGGVYRGGLGPGTAGELFRRVRRDPSFRGTCFSRTRPAKGKIHVITPRESTSAWHERRRVGCGGRIFENSAQHTWLLSSSYWARGTCEREEHAIDSDIIL